jgi:hypothetical protein
MTATPILPTGSGCAVITAIRSLPQRVVGGRLRGSLRRRASRAWCNCHTFMESLPASAATPSRWPGCWVATSHWCHPRLAPSTSSTL